MRPNFNDKHASCMGYILQLGLTCRLFIFVIIFKFLRT
jgi:hypothetical protein